MNVSLLINGADVTALVNKTFDRRDPFTGSVAMIGREPEPPYERPPLSKEYFAREKTFDRLYIRPPQPAESELLQLGSGEPVGEVVRVGFDADEQPIRVVVWVFPGSRMSLHYDLEA